MSLKVFAIHSFAYSGSNIQQDFLINSFIYLFFFNFLLHIFEALYSITACNASCVTLCSSLHSAPSTMQP